MASFHTNHTVPLTGIFSRYGHGEVVRILACPEASDRGVVVVMIMVVFSLCSSVCWETVDLTSDVW